MLSRLFYGFKDEPVSTGKLFVVMASQFILLLVFDLSLKLLLLITFLAALDVLSYYFERKWQKLNLIRLLFIVLVFILCGIFSSILLPDYYNQNLINFIDGCKSNSVIISEASRIDWQKLNLILFGSLFLLNEVNFGIRYFFEIFDLIPQVNRIEIRVRKRRIKNYNKEYNTGRIIGMLERILIFFFVLLGQYAAIGFIIAAKGFTRFKELENRSFAEYVLVGTLLSSFLAIGVAAIIKSLI
jgi:hypothetical protein